jgi:hypothetical protein
MQELYHHKYDWLGEGIPGLVRRREVVVAVYKLSPSVSSSDESSAYNGLFPDC